MNICVLCGGQSTEHEISLISAMNILAAFPATHTPFVVCIDKQGNWFWFPNGNFVLDADSPKTIRIAPGGIPVFPSRKEGAPVLMPLDGSRAPQPFDLLFPILHGKNGEDGSVQGLAQLLGCPCVGCAMTASAIGMDKAFAKHILEHQGIRTARWAEVKRGDSSLPDVSSLGLPLFVKPANAGSSVGVHKVTCQEELAKAVEQALQYDDKVLVEECIQGREIECAVLGNPPDLLCPRPGEIVSAVEFYSYDAKYTMSDGARVVAPTELPPGETEKVQALAKRIFTLLGCTGFSRVDFFFTKDGQWVFNEINTIPGFTNISMYPKLMQAAGISYSNLIEKLIGLCAKQP